MTTGETSFRESDHPGNDCKPKNYCNRTLIVKVIVENVVTFFGDTVYLDCDKQLYFLRSEG